MIKYNILIALLYQEPLHGAHGLLTVLTTIIIGTKVVTLPAGRNPDLQLHSCYSILSC